ncbi:hypothetical protein [Pseudomonas sp. UMAB-40]|uniref:hypothetical protein n=1 Tax=Pseudomonas sp. UMAB-40 TaxID=1365407 RepID=UPI001C59E02A|nr:hypothetical protein [Pseudomonas sp. UMAB-40]
MLMTMSRFKKNQPGSKKKTAIRVAVCLALAPFVFSAGYAVLMLIMIAMWKIGNALGDNGKMLPYSIFAFVFLCLWLVWEFRANKKLYREYLCKQPPEKLIEMISAPQGVYSKSEMEFAREALQEAAPVTTAQPAV